MPKITFHWAPALYSESYVQTPSRDPERGRIVPVPSTSGAGTIVVAMVWGPNAKFEATEAQTFMPDGTPDIPYESTAEGRLKAKARAWIEERVAALDKEVGK